MTRKQMVFIIVVNAVISTLITVLLVLVILPSLSTTKPAATSTLESYVAAGLTESAAKTMPAPTSVIHVVQPGDTISGLAFKYDVSEEDIIAANHLQNPNFLQVGMELFIPIGGLPQTTATLTPVPTATETPIPFEPPSADMTATAAAEAGATATSLPTPLPSTGELGIEITEVIGVGEVEQEQVVITNVGDRLADMQGWALSDAHGNTYTFPNFRLWAGGNVTVHTRIGQDGNPPANLFWGKLEAIWSLGEVIMLKNADGDVIATYTVGP